MTAPQFWFRKCSPLKKKTPQIWAIVHCHSICHQILRNQSSNDDIDGSNCTLKFNSFPHLKPNDGVFRKWWARRWWCIWTSCANTWNYVPIGASSTMHWEGQRLLTILWALCPPTQMLFVTKFWKCFCNSFGTLDEVFEAHFNVIESFHRIVEVHF